MSDYKEYERFRTQLKYQLNQFEAFLQKTLKPRTINRHIPVITSLIDFLCFDCSVSDYSQIRRSMVCSRFRQFHCSNTGDAESQVKTSVKKFISFLVFEKGIFIDKNVLKGLNLSQKSAKKSSPSRLKSPQSVTNSLTVFEKLSAWYEAQCNEDWEHHYGIKIETLDNPGWLVTIDLFGTNLENKPFSEIHHNVDSKNNPIATKWLCCTVSNAQYIGAGDSSQLEKIIAHFCLWLEQP